MKIGASEVIVKDVKNLFVDHFVWPAIKMGLIYEKRYLLGTSLARPCITLALMGRFIHREIFCRFKIQFSQQKKPRKSSTALTSPTVPLEKATIKFALNYQATL